MLCSTKELSFPPSCLSGGFYFLSGFLPTSYQLAGKKDNLGSLTYPSPSQVMFT